MPDNQNHLYQDPLVTALLVLAASNTEQVNRLAGLSQAINTLREAFNSINNGLNLFYSDVVPLLINENPSKSHTDMEDAHEDLHEEQDYSEQTV